MRDGEPGEEVIDTIGDEHARTVLAEISRKPGSVQDLEKRLDLSQPTIYRRLGTLKKHDLVSEQTLVANDGNHYKVYRCTFNSTIISLENDEYQVRIFREENLPERFTQLWDEIGK